MDNTPFFKWGKKLLQINHIEEFNVVQNGDRNYIAYAVSNSGNEDVSTDYTEGFSTEEEAWAYIEEIIKRRCINPIYIKWGLYYIKLEDVDNFEVYQHDDGKWWTVLKNKSGGKFSCGQAYEYLSDAQEAIEKILGKEYILNITQGDFKRKE